LTSTACRSARRQAKIRGPGTDRRPSASEEKERGLEPDECYSRGKDKEIPDLALEVVATRGSIDKLEVYRGLGTREVWVFENGTFRLFALHGEGYALIPSSKVLPEVDLTRLAHFAKEVDQHTALRAFRDELRGTS
jgi:Uma2 family endonuclease